MNCPKCTQTQLVKKAPASPYSCIRCKGLWLKSIETDKIIHLSKDEQNPASFSQHGHDSRTGICPEGHGILVRAQVPADEPFYLEKCMQCGGIWFDQGELKTLIENNLIDYLAEFWTGPWRRKQLQESDRASFLQLNKDLLGLDIYQQTIDLAEKVKNHPEKSRVIDLLRHELF